MAGAPGAVCGILPAWPNWIWRREAMTRWIPLLEPKDPIAPGSHPTDLLLSPDEKWLYVALSNADAIATVDTASGSVIHLASTNLAGQEHAGTYPTALAQSPDGTRLFVADSSLNAVAVFDSARADETGHHFSLAARGSGFHSDRLVSQRLAVRGDDLLIATAKGEGAGPNSGISQLKGERRRREHPYIPTLMYGSLSRLNFRNVEKRLPRVDAEGRGKQSLPS